MKMQLLACPICNGQVAFDAEMCPHCGKQLEPKLFKEGHAAIPCWSCRALNLARADSVCRACGKDLSQERDTYVIEKKGDAGDAALFWRCFSFLLY